MDLNKKLAEWAGFKVANNSFEDLDGITHWADFTQSLDACFKWLVPEFKQRFGGEALYKLLQQWVLELSLNTDVVKPEALALCLAIEKLIDGG